VLLALDERRFSSKVDCLTHTAWRAWRSVLATDADYLLYFEDDVAFNQRLFENLSRWGPLLRRELHAGSLCNLGFRELAWDVPGCAYLVHPLKIRGSLALLLSRRMLQYCLDHWEEGPPDLDLKVGHLAALAEQPFFAHTPSLVQHIGRVSTLGHEFQTAADFDPAWLSDASAGCELVPAAFSAAGVPVVAHD
jgi:hypothetical protein